MNRDCSLNNGIGATHVDRERHQSMNKPPLVDRDEEPTEIEFSSSVLPANVRDNFSHKAQSCTVADPSMARDISTSHKSQPSQCPQGSPNSSAMPRNTSASVAAAQEVPLTIITTATQSATNDYMESSWVEKPANSVVSEQPHASPSSLPPSHADRLAAAIAPNSTSTPSSSTSPTPSFPRHDTLPSLTGRLVAAQEVTEEAQAQQQLQAQRETETRAGTGEPPAGSPVRLPGPNEAPPPYVDKQPRSSHPMRLPYYLTAIPPEPPPPYSLTDDMHDNWTTPRIIPRRAAVNQTRTNPISEDEVKCGKSHKCLCVSGCTVCVLFSLFALFV